MCRDMSDNMDKFMALKELAGALHDQPKKAGEFVQIILEEPELKRDDGVNAFLLNLYSLSALFPMIDGDELSNFFDLMRALSPDAPGVVEAHVKAHFAVACVRLSEDDQNRRASTKASASLGRTAGAHESSVDVPWLLERTCEYAPLEWFTEGGIPLLNALAAGAAEASRCGRLCITAAAALTEWTGLCTLGTTPSTLGTTPGTLGPR